MFRGQWGYMLGELEARLFPKGVYVITSRWHDRKAGMTAAWVTRVSGTPPAMMVAIHHQSDTGETIAKSGWYVINVLDEEQLEIARRFGQGSSRNRDKFRGLAMMSSAHGQPVISTAMAYLECKVILLPPVGDHTLHIGNVMEERQLRAGAPLLYNQKKFE